LAIAIGLLLRYAGGLTWFGHLPGDIRVQGTRGSFYAPIVSMVVASVVLSVLATLVARLFRGP
jgi:TctA family transporter